MQNGPGEADILEFIATRTGRRLSALERADVLRALDLEGEAAEAFMVAFGHAFGVDLKGYEAAYHHRDGARAGRFGWPLPVPLLFGLRIPVAVSTLAEAARSGRWPLRYPVLEPRPARDWVNWVLVLGALPVLVTGLLLIWRGF